MQMKQAENETRVKWHTLAIDDIFSQLKTQQPGGVGKKRLPGLPDMGQ
jgi:hypothetical protein